MYIRNRYLSVLYKAAVFLLTGVGLYLNSGLPRHLNLSILKYYTMLSNLLCFLYFGAALVYGIAVIRRLGGRGGAVLLPRFKGAVTIAILVTLLIYQFLLADTPFSMGAGSSLGNNLVHLFVPVLVILDWLLFDAKGRFHVQDPCLWCALPMIYWGCTLLAARLGVTYMAGSRYPYGFIDIDRLGFLRVAQNVGLLLLGFLVLCYLIYSVDKLLSRGKKKEIVYITH